LLTSDLEFDLESFGTKTLPISWKLSVRFRRSVT